MWLIDFDPFKQLGSGNSVKQIALGIVGPRQGGFLPETGPLTIVWRIAAASHLSGIYLNFISYYLPFQKYVVHEFGNILQLYWVQWPDILKKIELF